MMANKLIKPLLFATEKVVEYYYPKEKKDPNEEEKTHPSSD